MKFILYKKLPDYLDMSKATCRRYYHAFVSECNKIDTKLDTKYYIEASTHAKWVDEDAFVWYLQHKQQLDDTTARQRVHNYIPKEAVR